MVTASASIATIVTPSPGKAVRKWLHTGVKNLYDLHPGAPPAGEAGIDTLESVVSAISRRDLEILPRIDTVTKAAHRTA